VNSAGAREQPEYSRLLSVGVNALADAGLDDPSNDARLLLCAAAGCDRARLITHPRLITNSVIQLYMAYLDRRSHREPVQYIIGEWEFMGLPFTVSRDVLIPRADTECLVENILSSSAASATETPAILDLCTGSGCVAVSLAVFLPRSFIVAADISARALTVASANARRNGVADRVVLLEGDLYNPVAKYADKTKTADGAGGLYSHIHAFISNTGGLRFDVICATRRMYPVTKCLYSPKRYDHSNRASPSTGDRADLAFFTGLRHRLVCG